MRDMRKFTSRFFDLVAQYKELFAHWEQDPKNEQKHQSVIKCYNRMKQQFSSLDSQEVLQFEKNMSKVQLKLATEGYSDRYKNLFAAMTISEQLIPEIMFDGMFDKLLVYDQNTIIKGRHLDDLEAIRTRIFKVFENFTPTQAHKFLSIIKDRRESVCMQENDPDLLHKLETCDELECMLIAFHQYIENEQCAQ